MRKLKLEANCSQWLLRSDYSDSSNEPFHKNFESGIIKKKKINRCDINTSDGKLWSTHPPFNGQTRMPLGIRIRLAKCRTAVSQA